MIKPIETQYNRSRFDPDLNQMPVLFLCPADSCVSEGEMTGWWKIVDNHEFSLEVQHGNSNYWVEDYLVEPAHEESTFLTFKAIMSGNTTVS